MHLALRLALRGYGRTSPNPMVGALLVKQGIVLGRGWHRQAGAPHAEIEALRDAERLGHSPKGAVLYVTLEPCSTRGRTPPCTEAIIRAGVSEVVAAATDPNPQHGGRGYAELERAGIRVSHGLLEAASARLNEPFNHWIVQRTPFVTVKAAMSLDGKIATVSRASKWITGARARAVGMTLRAGSDAILVGVNTIIADDPQLTVRRGGVVSQKPLRRIILDSTGRAPLHSKVFCDSRSALTTVVLSESACPERVAQFRDRVQVLQAPIQEGKLDLEWVLRALGREGITSLLVEGGAEVNASFLLSGHAHRIAFFYAPRILGGRDAPGAVGGVGVGELAKSIRLERMEWRKLGSDFLLTALVQPLQLVKTE